MTGQSHTDLWDAARAAIEDVQALQGDERRRYRASGHPLPPTIGVGGGEHVFTTREGIEAICRIAEDWRLEDATRKARIDHKRMRELAVREYGQMLADNGMQFHADTRQAVRTFKERLQQGLDAAHHAVDHYFPCHVFEVQLAHEFSVGPVRFLCRNQWLDHVASSAHPRPTWTQMVRDYWEGKISLPERGTGTATHNARDAIDTIGPCLTVAVVTVTGNDIGRSQERARYAVRLALDAIGLALPLDSARRLRGPGDELGARRTGTMSQTHGVSMNWGTRVDRPMLFGDAPQAHAFLADTIDLREAAGWAIDGVVRLPSKIDQPALRRRWCDALYWFGEARRDATEFTALVRYGMCLDVLAKGGKNRGITALMCALWGCAESDPILSNGTSMKKAVTTLYDEGRSQLGHGTRQALLEDLPFPRALADEFASLALVNYVLTLRRYTGSDNYESFLSAIPTLRLL